MLLSRRASRCSRSRGTPGHTLGPRKHHPEHRPYKPGRATPARPAHTQPHAADTSGSPKQRGARCAPRPPPRRAEICAQPVAEQGRAHRAGHRWDFFAAIGVGVAEQRPRTLFLTVDRELTRHILIRFHLCEKLHKDTCSAGADEKTWQRCRSRYRRVRNILHPLMNMVRQRLPAARSTTTGGNQRCNRAGRADPSPDC